jgi:putative peptidoglycan lipid II flippase
LTLFHSKKFSLLHVNEASWILIGFLIGLFFFSLNKILLNLYYALHDTKIPLYISIVVTIINGLLSYFVLMPWGGSFGIALATTMAGMVQTILFIVGLRYRFNLPFYGRRFVQFATRYVLQLAMCSVFFLAAYYGIEQTIKSLPQILSQFLLVQVGLWLWVVPLCVVFFAALYKTRRYCGVHAYFLEQ